MSKFLRYPLRRLRRNWHRITDDLAMLLGWLLIVLLLFVFGLRLSML